LLRDAGLDGEPASGSTPGMIAADRRAQSVDVIPPGARVLVAAKPGNLRKGMDGLAALVTAELGTDPFSGVVYAFRAKKAYRVKLIWWDGTGLCLMHTRDSRVGCGFRWPAAHDGVIRLSAAQLATLIEGLDWRRVRATQPPLTPRLAG